MRSKSRWFNKFCNSYYIFAFCRVLHRCENQEVHRWKVYFVCCFCKLVTLVSKSRRVGVKKKRVGEAFKKRQLTEERIQLKALKTRFEKKFVCWFVVEIDPSAGSPTETLLRLLLPLDSLVCKVSSAGSERTPKTSWVRLTHQLIQSVGATGGVYKGQGRIHCALMMRAY